MIDAARVINSRRLLTSYLISHEPPKYRSLLRAFGAYFDQEQARYVTLAEIDGGFLWHFFPGGELLRTTHGILAYEDVPDFAESIKQTRIVQMAARMQRQK